MRIDELITAVRLAGRFNDNDTDYTSARIRQELTNTLHTIFGHPIIQARAGSWLKQSVTTTTAGRTRYRIPHRACTGVGESVELGDFSQALYEILGDQVVFDTAPQAGSELRFTYYQRPSLLVQEQAAAGEVAEVDTDALTVTVDTALPVNRVTAATIDTGDYLDIVHPNGWHELSLVNVTSTISGLVLTFPEGTDLTDVEVGDFVRAADQTDWPCIPDDFHQTLADMTASRICRAKGRTQRAKELAEDAASEIARFADILQPRVKDTRPVIVPRVGVIRGGRTRRWPVATP